MTKEKLIRGPSPDFNCSAEISVQTFREVWDIAIHKRRQVTPDLSGRVHGFFKCESIENMELPA
jgi:hypothetical protein